MIPKFLLVAITLIITSVGNMYAQVEIHIRTTKTFQHIAAKIHPNLHLILPDSSFSSSYDCDCYTTNQYNSKITILIFEKVDAKEQSMVFRDAMKNSTITEKLFYLNGETSVLLKIKNEEKTTWILITSHKNNTYILDGYYPSLMDNQLSEKFEKSLTSLAVTDLNLKSDSFFSSKSYYVELKDTDFTPKGTTGNNFTNTRGDALLSVTTDWGYMISNDKDVEAMAKEYKDYLIKNGEKTIVFKRIQTENLVGFSVYAQVKNDYKKNNTYKVYLYSIQDVKKFYILNAYIDFREQINIKQIENIVKSFRIK